MLSRCIYAPTIFANKPDKPPKRRLMHIRGRASLAARQRIQARQANGHEIKMSPNQFPSL
jgi:hypothetical protein